MRTVLFGILVSFNLVACVTGDNDHDPIEEDVPANLLDQVADLDADREIDLHPAGNHPAIDRVDLAKQVSNLQQVPLPQFEQETAIDVDVGEIDAELEQDRPRPGDHVRPAR